MRRFPAEKAPPYAAAVFIQRSHKPQICKAEQRLSIFGPRNDRLDSLLKPGHIQHDDPAAGQTFDLDIASHADDLPLSSAARMRLPGDHPVSNLIAHDLPHKSIF